MDNREEVRDFLRSRPALHTMHLTATEKHRANGVSANPAETPVFGRLERDGEVHAGCYQRTPTGYLSLTSMVPDQADALTHLQREVRMIQQGPVAVGQLGVL